MLKVETAETAELEAAAETVHRDIVVKTPMRTLMAPTADLVVMEAVEETQAKVAMQVKVESFMLSKCRILIFYP